MQIADVMTPNPRTVQPDDTLQSAAQLMDELNVGVLPVSDDGRLIGMLTDRDIVIRSTSAGQDPRTATVADAMTGEVRSLPLYQAPLRLTHGRSPPRHGGIGSPVRQCLGRLVLDASVLDAVRMMKDQQLRRVPVVDTGGKLVGILSLGDLADAGTPEAGDALEAISTPAEPDR